MRSNYRMILLEENPKHMDLFKVFYTDDGKPLTGYPIDIAKLSPSELKAADIGLRRPPLLLEEFVNGDTWLKDQAI